MKKYHIFSFLFCFLFSGQIILAQTKQDIQTIKAASNIKALQKLEQKFSQESKQEKAEAIKLAKEKGWLIKGKLEDGSFVELMKIVDGKPIYYKLYNVNAAKSTRANTLNTGGLLGLNLNGENMTVRVWDGGHVLVTHQEYDGPAGNNRVTTGDPFVKPPHQDYRDHAGHVMGTILAYGAQSNAKGMAPKAKGISYDWSDDKAEATKEVSEGMILSNHSYGYVASKVPDQYFGAYIEESMKWDEIMYNAPHYLMVCAAGNDGNDNWSNGQPLDGNSSYDKLSGHATSKNNLVVANANDAPINANGEISGTVVRNSSSSEGPTDDYRIKPDITGNGTEVYSPAAVHDTHYRNMTGTSMASPNVTGTLLLIQQHYKNKHNSFMKAASIKGLALHTADDIASNGPDATTGWGLLNGKKAAQVISDVTKNDIKELTLNANQTYTTTVTASGTEDLKVSISWTDPAGQKVSATNSKTAVLVNDLDLKVEKDGTTYYPWKLTSITANAKGDNDVDPFERVDIANASGTYTITVSHEGNLTNNSQNFTLIVTGIGNTSNDTEAPTAPTNLVSSNITSNSVGLSWTASTDNEAVTGYEIYKDGTLTKTVTTTNANVTGLNASTTYSFTVKAKDAAGNTSAASNAVSVTTEEGTNPPAEYCSSKGNDYSYEWIAKVQVGNQSKESEGNGYSDFKATTFNVSNGTNVTLTPGFMWSSYPEYWKVWIDFNKNGVFTDAGEEVIAKSGNAAVSGTITVPAGVSGETIMRISMKYETAATPCETFSYGEVEDYTVNVQSSYQAPSILAEGTNNSKDMLYPVPAKDKLTAKISAISGSDVKIISVTGSIVETVIATGDILEFDVSNYNSGMYFIQYFNGTKTNSLSFFVQ